MADLDEIIGHYNRFHSAVYGAHGALDRKMRHLICHLGAALGVQAASPVRNALPESSGNSGRVIPRSMKTLPSP